jgi:hypothetical protein
VEGRAQEAQEVGATSSPVQALRSPVRLVGTRQSGRRGHVGVSLAEILTKLEFSKFFFWHQCLGNWQVAVLIIANIESTGRQSILVRSGRAAAISP